MAIIFSDFESREQSQKRFLLIFTIALKSNPATKYTVYACDIPPSGFSHQYMPILKQVPAISKNIQGLESKAMPSWGEISLVRDIELPLVLQSGGVEIMADDLIAGTWIVAGQPVQILYGGDELAENLYSTIYKGYLKGIKNIKRTEFTFESTDSQAALQNVYINPNLITAASYPNAPDANVGKPKPVGLGNCKNVSPILIDKTIYKYMFHDVTTIGYSSLDAVYDDGIAVAYTHNNDGTFTKTTAPAGQITCSFSGGKFGSPTAYKNKIGDIAVGLLKSFAAYTDAQIDLTAMSTFNTDISYSVGLWLDTKTDILTVLNQLFEGIPAYYSMTRASVFFAKEFKLPIGSADITIKYSDDPCINYEKEICYKKQINYNRNRTVIPIKQSGGSDIAYKTWLANEWSAETYTNSAILTTYPLATEDKPANTCLINRADALAIATKWIAIKGGLRSYVEFEVKPLKMAYEIGKEVKFVYPAFGFSSGKNGIIVTLNEQYGENKAKITIMMIG